MTNLEILLRSYNMFNPSSPEDLFDSVFDRSVRIVLDGRTYKREFLLFQETQNFQRRWNVDRIDMEILDKESFHYTYRIEDLYDPNESYNDDSSSSSSSLSQASSLSSTFHAMATVKNGKIVKIKPMTGLAFIDLFESNISHSIGKTEESKTLGLEGKELSTIPKTHQCRRRSSVPCIVRRLSGKIFPRLRCEVHRPQKTMMPAE